MIIISTLIKKLQIKTNIPKDEIFIKGDPVRLTQVIENILHNALKFTLKEDKIIIALKKDQATKEAVISIKDTGKGIEIDVLENIFEPFVQSKNDYGKSYAGLGIGLSIVKDIIDRHNGHISILSKGENRGTEVIIRIPILDILEKSN